MYNRYTPQPDGTYRRNRIETPESPSVHPASEAMNMYPESQQKTEETMCCSSSPAVHQQSAGSFLRQLLPKNIDTGDLLIIVLLLLMAGDCTDDRNNALLTLALYLFL